MLYHEPEDSSTPGKKVSQWKKFSVLAMLLDHMMNTHFLCPLQWHTVLTGSTRIPVHPRNMLYHGPQDSSKARKPVLPWTSISIVAISVDQAVTHILGRYSSTEWWLIPLGHPFAHERCSTKDQKAHQHLENRLCHKGKSVFWPLILNQITNTDFLIQLWW